MEGVETTDPTGIFMEKARENPARIVYPEGGDERIAAAALRAAREGVARPVLIGDPSFVRRVAHRMELPLDGVEIVEGTEGGRAEEFAEEYARARNVGLGVARKLVARPLVFGGMMVRAGAADAMVAGAAHPTASLIQAASLTVGLKEGFSSPTSYFVMVVPNFLGGGKKVFIFADSAVTIAPSARQLASAALAVAEDARHLLGIEPRVAFLSCSTKGSASHPDIEKVVEAVRIAREAGPDFALDGELQVDAAVVPRVARLKVKESPVAGKANVLMFPDLDAGNIAYKIVQYMADATALGPILVGFNRPVNDLSRGAVVEDIVGMSAITSVQARSASGVAAE